MKKKQSKIQIPNKVFIRYFYMKLTYISSKKTTKKVEKNRFIIYT